MSGGFAVGVSMKNTPQSQQFAAQIAVIFNNAVMHQSHLPNNNGVRIVGDRGAVSRPAGVSNTASPVSFLGGGAQFVNTPGDCNAARFRLGGKSKTGGIIAAIFQRRQAAQ